MRGAAPTAGLLAVGLIVAIGLPPDARGQQNLERPPSPPAAVDSRPVAGPAGPVDLKAWQRGSAAPGPAAGSGEYLRALEHASIRALEIKTEFDQIHLDYERKRLEQRARTFAWQQRSTQFIFYLVVLIVASGLGLSFWHVYRREAAPIKLTVGEKGIEFNSRLIGVLVFVLSLAFFYLYVKTVYPITELGAGAEQGGAETPPG